MKFNNPQEMYDLLQACHGGEENSEGLTYEEQFQEFQNMTEEETFGTWDWDYYQCGNDLFCYEYTHNNTLDNKTYVFYFYDDGSDTIEDDEVFGSPEEAFDSTIDYGFLNAIAGILGKDPIK